MSITLGTRYGVAAILLLALVNISATCADPLNDKPKTISRNIQHTTVAKTPKIIRFQRRAVIPSTSIQSPQAAPQETKQPQHSTQALAKQVTTQASSKIALTRHEQLLISKAKRYFEQNWNPTTGLIDSVQGYSHTTMWDVASGIAGLLALEALSENSKQVTEFRLEKMLDTLIELPLYKQLLPNRQYNTRTARPSGRFSHTASNGNGWSALDLGRLYIWLEILARHKPLLAPKVNQVKSKWLLKHAVHKGNLYGTKLTSQREYFRQEGRLGYLQYAATGYQLAGLNVKAAFKCDHLDNVELNKVNLLIDKGNLPFFTLDPYLLYAIEIGNQQSCWNQLDELYQVHKVQAEKHNKLIAYAEDSLSKTPWFLYNNISYQGAAWQSVSHSGKSVSYPQTFSNKAAYAMSVLFNGPYSRNLAELVINNSARHNVVPTGLYANGKTNTAYNINTNSLILVSLWYKTRNKQAILPPVKQAQDGDGAVVISTQEPLNE
ncbi:DUF3131 domain-containing protein [Shewanella fidelis]|uniref:DUF3131 domain-containing protein n=1 Tax=Shewanella fidelis TaxID=173509 RepID=A0AAW8NVA1_9GAMM|nr:DUF3131 domain-containing protein [Shewanella fidelis]MDR8526136.1 DUF3131 domain-containing protein [Shewanella fidelis]MDW4813749.1 DUF3131 domain-containing protein [Shewanella fidelis]MDW4817845.1 DUF3131 domain-containing protein [Shewanella fidelis]MDW4821894.1 DUF3131 domain-containing protein [Shewanella fidelis]MDW4826077.1 DUF3131 domain-containing protein [Shewanella fidelis]